VARLLGSYISLVGGILGRLDELVDVLNLDNDLVAGIVEGLGCGT
jgi:hypothetical protein